MIVLKKRLTRLLLLVGLLFIFASCGSSDKENTAAANKEIVEQKPNEIGGIFLMIAKNGDFVPTILNTEMVKSLGLDDLVSPDYANISEHGVDWVYINDSAAICCRAYNSRAGYLTIKDNNDDLKIMFYLGNPTVNEQLPKMATYYGDGLVYKIDGSKYETKVQFTQTNVIPENPKELYTPEVKSIQIDVAENLEFVPFSIEHYGNNADEATATFISTDKTAYLLVIAKRQS